MENLKSGSDVLFILLGAVMVLAMHSGFAFLELGTVRRKSQVNALVKILCDFAVSTIAYFFIGYTLAYGVNFLGSAEQLADKSGYELVRFFFLLTFAAAVPAIVSGGIAERAKFSPQLAATFLLVGFVYPFFEGIAWNDKFGVQAWIEASAGAKFHDFAGSIVVHAVGGWIGLMAVLLLGARSGRYTRDGKMSAHPPSSIPFLALGAWILSVGWFGFNVMSAQTIDKISGLVAVNSLMAMAGGTLAALVAGRNDPGFVHNGPLASNLAIPAYDANAEVVAELTTQVPMKLAYMQPHMHLRGKDFELRLICPSGETRTVLKGKWDFNWQLGHDLAEPIDLPVGTRIISICHYDNSAGNKANPDPSKLVWWGDQNWDEMQNIFIGVLVDPKADQKTFFKASGPSLLKRSDSGPTLAALLLAPGSAPSTRPARPADENP